jgi:hypothetical protein
MGHAIPRQDPAVVLRSHFNQVRALLAIALIAVVGLTIAVVVLASEDDEVAGTSVAKPIESINYGDSVAVNPSTGYPTTQIQPELPRRYDGGPVSRYEGESKYFVVPPAGSAGSQDGAAQAGSGSAVKDYSLNGATGDYARGPVQSDPPAKDYSKNSATGDF